MEIWGFMFWLLVYLEAKLIIFLQVHFYFMLPQLISLQLFCRKICKWQYWYVFQFANTLDALSLLFRSI